MSFSRWSKDCNVYTFENTLGKFECCGCAISKECPEYDTPKELIEHLKEHIKAGHKVPKYLLELETYEEDEE